MAWNKLSSLKKAPVTDMGEPLPEISTPPTPDHTATPAITRVTAETKSHTKAAATSNRRECTPPPLSPLLIAPHTPTPHRRQRRSTPTPDDDDDRARHIREQKVRATRKDATQRSPRRTPTHHIAGTSSRVCTGRVNVTINVRLQHYVACELPRSTPPLSPETAG